jgi:hypothetical protein
MSVTALFIGPDDNETCNGCEDAVEGNPYTIETCPQPGDQECMSRCRHAIQIDGNAPSDMPTMTWRGSLGFQPELEPAEPALVDTITPDEGMQSPVDLVNAWAKHDSDILSGILTDDPKALEYAKQLAVQGFDDVDAVSAYNLADALNDVTNHETWHVILHAGRWYVQAQSS